jgi:prepilin-type N-terminal cleavage/methylation domain-containing protein
VLREIKQSGFSLIELVIVVAIVAVVAAIAVPRLSRGAEAAGVNAFASTLSELASVVESYQAENGEKPKQAPGMAMPDVVADQFYGERGSTFTSLGGGEWNYMLSHDGEATICAKFDDAPSEDRLREVDVLLDDGDLTSGLFCKKNSKKYEFTIR